MATTNGTREIYLRPTAFEVASETKPNVTYRVMLPDCECPDFKYRRTSNPQAPFCKHILAAFSQAGWQLPIRDTSRLDEATARELLLDVGLGIGTVNAVLARSRQRLQGSHDTGAGFIVVVYSKAHDRYDVRLPA